MYDGMAITNTPQTSRRFIRLRGKAGLRLPKRPLLYSAAVFLVVGLTTLTLQLIGIVNLASHPVYADAINTTDFVTTWKTDNSGTSNDSSITIPTNGNGYNYSVDWNNDGIPDQTGITGSVTHDFGIPGTYTIRISGTFPQIYFNWGGDREKLVAINQWGAIQWRSMELAFAGATNLTAISTSDAPNLGNVTSLYAMFNGTAVNQPVSNWDTSHVTNMSNMFDGASVFNQPLNNWDTSHVTNMSNMFVGATSFNQPLNNWDTSNVVEMYGMFGDAKAFNQPLNSWDMGKVNSVDGMFQGASAFNQSLNGWNMSNLTSLYGMFQGAKAFNQPLNNWDTSHVTNMSYMFADATSFNQALDNWNVSNVKDMSSMFFRATSFNQSINNWDTSSLTNGVSIFYGATSFNQPLNNWDTSHVTNMNAIFYGATSFDQSLASWDISSVEGMYLALNYSGMSRSNYDNTLSGWAVEVLKNDVMFGAGNLRYCSSQSARQSMIDNFGWTIDGDIYDCSVNPEDLGPNGGDGNGDGVLDSLQADVSTVQNQALDGDRYVTIQVQDSNNNCSTIGWAYQDGAVQYTGVTDADYEYPVGVTDFGVSCSTPGGNTRVTIYYDKLYDTSKWIARKFSWATNSYKTISGVTFGTFNRNGVMISTMSYVLEDGGPLDDDGQVNGQIIDPIGPAVFVASSSNNGEGNNGGASEGPGRVQREIKAPNSGVVPRASVSMFWVGYILIIAGIGVCRLGHYKIARR